MGNGDKVLYRWAAIMKFLIDGHRCRGSSQMGSDNEVPQR